MNMKEPSPGALLSLARCGGRVVLVFVTDVFFGGNHSLRVVILVLGGCFVGLFGFCVLGFWVSRCQRVMQR